jgi:pyruvate dehydrogenase E1 component beta subunit
VVIVHEAPQTAGFGAEIAAIIAEEAFDGLHALIKRVCARDMPVPAGPAALASLPSETRIEAALSEVLAARRTRPTRD